MTKLQSPSSRPLFRKQMSVPLLTVMLCSALSLRAASLTAPPQSGSAQSEKPRPPATPEQAGDSGKSKPRSQEKSGTTAVEQHISPQEAAELFKSVDEILKFTSDDTGLPIHTTVKRELASREQVEKYISERMAEDEDEKRFERTELVLKKFGLLPREFDLRPFTLKLLRDQVAGFYDAKRKTVHLLDWIPAQSQRPVLAHELTHALQDQSIDLERWIKSERDRIRATTDADNADSEIDEEVSARTALVEGQGMAVLIDYILKPGGGSVADSPQLVEAFKQGMSSNEGSEILTNAPMLLRESLIFPYRDGLGFVQAALGRGGKKLAYSGALMQPPHDTHEILSPKSYLDKVKIPWMVLPNFNAALGKDYERYDAGSVGQFDIVLLLKQFADAAAVNAISPEWRGGVYFAAKKKSPTSSAPPSSNVTSSTKDLSLIYASRWGTPQAAKRFAEIYGNSLSKRYRNVTKRDDQWQTDEGPISIEVLGSDVLVIESFNPETAAAMRKTMLESMQQPQRLPTGSHAVASSNLSLRVVAPVFAVRLLLR